MASHEGPEFPICRVDLAGETPSEWTPYNQSMTHYRSVVIDIDEKLKLKLKLRMMRLEAGG